MKTKWILLALSVAGSLAGCASTPPAKAAPKVAKPDPRVCYLVEVHHEFDSKDDQQVAQIARMAGVNREAREQQAAQAGKVKAAFVQALQETDTNWTYVDEPVPVPLQRVLGHMERAGATLTLLVGVHYRVDENGEASSIRATVEPLHPNDGKLVEVDRVPIDPSAYRTLASSVVRELRYLGAKPLDPAAVRSDLQESITQTIANARKALGQQRKLAAYRTATRALELANEFDLKSQADKLAAMLNEIGDVSALLKNEEQVKALCGRLVSRGLWLKYAAGNIEVRFFKNLVPGSYVFHADNTRGGYEIFDHDLALRSDGVHLAISVQRVDHLRGRGYISKQFVQGVVGLDGTFKGTIKGRTSSQKVVFFGPLELTGKIP